MKEIVIVPPGFEGKILSKGEKTLAVRNDFGKLKQ